jgi:NitT/TauT family transport system substrate-binding protein
MGRFMRPRRVNASRCWLTLLATVSAISAGLAASAAAQTPWRHGIIEAKSDAGITFMASKRDLAGRLGLKLDLVQLKNDTIALKALLAGELDSYEGGAGGAMVAAARGADVRIVGCYWLAAPHGVYARAGIASMAGLRGKSVAVSTPRFPTFSPAPRSRRPGLPLAKSGWPPWDRIPIAIRR